MIENKKYRQRLIARYLEADTTVQEEILLGEYYSTHKVDADESDVAGLILMDWPKAEVLSDTEHKKGIRHISIAITAIAACVALLIIFIKPHIGCEFTPIEIAENINILMEFNVHDVESIVAKPQGSRVILTATMKDGSSSTFIMIRNRKDGSTRILANNK